MSNAVTAGTSHATAPVVQSERPSVPHRGQGNEKNIEPERLNSKTGGSGSADVVATRHLPARASPGETNKASSNDSGSTNRRKPSDPELRVPSVSQMNSTCLASDPSGQVESKNASTGTLGESSGRPRVHEETKDNNMILVQEHKENCEKNTERSSKNPSGSSTPETSKHTTKGMQVALQDGKKNAEVSDSTLDCKSVENESVGQTPQPKGGIDYNGRGKTVDEFIATSSSMAAQSSLQNEDSKSKSGGASNAMQTTRQAQQSSAVQLTGAEQADSFGRRGRLKISSTVFEAPSEKCGERKPALTRSESGKGCRLLDEASADKANIEANASLTGKRRYGDIPGDEFAPDKRPKRSDSTPTSGILRTPQKRGEGIPEVQHQKIKNCGPPDFTLPRELWHLSPDTRVDLFDRRNGVILSRENSVTIRELPGILRRHIEYEPFVPTSTPAEDKKGRESRTSAKVRVSFDVKPQARLRASGKEGKAVVVTAGLHRGLVGKVEACIPGGWFVLSDLFKYDDASIIVHSSHIALLDDEGAMDLSTNTGGRMLSETRKREKAMEALKNIFSCSFVNSIETIKLRIEAWQDEAKSIEDAIANHENSSKADKGGGPSTYVGEADSKSVVTSILNDLVDKVVKTKKTVGGEPDIRRLREQLRRVKGSYANAKGELKAQMKAASTVQSYIGEALQKLGADKS